MKKNLLIVSIVVIVIVAGGAFYGGTLYGKSHAKPASFAGGSFQTRINRTGANGSNFISGNIISADSTSITVQVANNGSKIIFYSPATQIEKTISGTPDDLTSGTSVVVSGTTNSDGSVTANSIQLRQNTTGGPNAAAQ